ncbi:MAG TPA: NHL repeat-containing protein [Chloroflexota bacterium]|nr:NHL repeat-containing protein [Chloroflexota bacterium]
MTATGSRRLVGILTLVALVGIFFGVTGFELSLPRIGGGQTDERPVAGVRAVSASMLLKVGSTAPAGGDLAFLAVEPGGNLVISDAKRRVVMRFDPSGHLLSEWGPNLGTAILDEPAGVAVSGDSFFVIDRGTPRIFRLDTSGHVVATLALDQFGTYGLNGLTVDPTGNLYAADTGRNRILMLSPTGALLKTIGRPGADLGGLTQPMMSAFGPDGSLFVADWENNRIARWNASFEAVDAWSIGFHAFGVAVDPAGRLFVPDSDKRRVVAFTARGATLGEFGVPGSPPIEVVPKQVALAGGDRPSLYVLGGDGVQRLDLENTAAPPQSSLDVDYVSLLVIALLIAVVVAAVLSRRGRRGTALLGSTFDRPIGLDAKNGAQRQDQETGTDQDLLIAHHPKDQQ